LLDNLPISGIVRIAVGAMGIADDAPCGAGADEVLSVLPPLATNAVALNMPQERHGDRRMSDDDPFYSKPRTMKETVEHLKTTIEAMPKPAITADWERLEGTRRVRHKPSGCVFEWSFKDHVLRGRQTRMLVVNLLGCPSHLQPQDLRQITGWANFIAALEITTKPPRLDGLWDSA
jgi:hypothetical protein